MLVLKFNTEIPLTEPTEDFGFVTWFDVTIRLFDAEIPVSVGTARVAVINTAEALNQGISIHEILDADSAELSAIDPIFFEDGYYLKEEFENGIGMGVVYFDSVEVLPEWRNRKIEEAVVRRVLDTWGKGCEIGIMPVDNDDELARWQAFGFVLAHPATQGESGFMFTDLSLRHPRIVEADDDGNSFNLAPDDPIRAVPSDGPPS